MAILENKDDTNNFRSTLAQVLASLTFSLLSFTIGFVIGMSTIVIGALRNDHSPLGMNETEASWFGSLAYVVQPLGCGASAILQDVLGRKKCLMAVNILNLIAWIIIYFATRTAYLFIAQTIMGIAMGFLEAPVLSYIGEITQPRLRGVLTSFSGIFFNLGVMVITSMSNIMDWRAVVLYSHDWSISSFVYVGVSTLEYIQVIDKITALVFKLPNICQVPDSPAWLVTKGRVRDAEKAYQWLRGWVRPEDVKHELAAIVDYVKATQTPKFARSTENPAVKTNADPKYPVVKNRLQLLTDPGVTRPFRIIVLYLITMACASLLAMKPFFIEILETIGSPIRSHAVLAICGGLQTAGAICCGICMRLIGKRRLSFLSLGLSTVSCLGLGGYLTFQPNYPWIPVTLFFLSYFAGPLGIGLIPFVLIMELFPLRARGMASGICGACAHGIFFTTTKTYYNLVNLVGISGACYFYGAVGVLGFIYFYWDLPETEGISLEEIERKIRGRRNSIQYQTN
ncbi:facilitated trehalose transporter Tret1-like [Homalodisca vitripennis]|uniref:facilitated trehalose transporter Tret1-like n=1 Tax=Homalodisca vitripennis TaxID=197043 RepID=UPI001EEC5E2A|nr:facilitated trehalose transporter Tret1-like [Homalodisca vitripennis]